MAKKPLKPLSNEEVTEFLNQLMVGHRIHLSVEDSLKIIAESTSHKNLAAATLKTKELYIAGGKKSLSQAMTGCDRAPREKRHQTGVRPEGGLEAGRRGSRRRGRRTLPRQTQISNLNPGPKLAPTEQPQTFWGCPIPTK